MGIRRKISDGCIDLPRKRKGEMTVSRRIRCMKSQTGTDKSSTCKGPGAGRSLVTAGSGPGVGRSHVTEGTEFRKGCRESGVTRLENGMTDKRVVGERKRNDKTGRQAGTQT